MKLKTFNFETTAAAAEYAAGIVSKCAGIAAAGLDLVTAAPTPALRPAQAFRFG